MYTFGHRYIFAGQEPRADAGIPDYLRPLTDIASQISGMPANAFEQLMVTEYAPGAGIGWHRDRPTYEDIVAVSFLAPCTLRAPRAAVSLFAAWLCAQQLTAQHRSDERVALLSDPSNLPPWSRLALPAALRPSRRMTENRDGPPLQLLDLKERTDGFPPKPVIGWGRWYKTSSLCL